MWRSKVKDQRGQAMVEMAIVLPILLLLTFGIIEFGIIFSNQLNINSAAREGARAASVGLRSKDSELRDDIFGIIGGTATGRTVTIIRTPTENLTATPPVLSTDVTCTITYPVKIVIPIISNIILTSAEKTTNEKVLTASVTMRIE